MRRRLKRHNFTTNLCKYQIVIAKKTVDHCTELLKAHNGDAERELMKALKENNDDIKSYHGSSFVLRQSLHVLWKKWRQHHRWNDKSNETQNKGCV